MKEFDLSMLAGAFGDPEEGAAFEFVGMLWIWRSQNPETTASWHFVTVDPETSAAIKRAALGRTGGFGSIKVKARIGGTEWKTSLFPHKESGGYFLPVKASVRKAERLIVDQALNVTLELAG